MGESKAATPLPMVQVAKIDRSTIPWAQELTVAGLLKHAVSMVVAAALPTKPDRAQPTYQPNARLFTVEQMLDYDLRQVFRPQTAFVQYLQQQVQLRQPLALTYTVPLIVEIGKRPLEVRLVMAEVQGEARQGLAIYRVDVSPAVQDEVSGSWIQERIDARSFPLDKLHLDLPAFLPQAPPA